MSRVTVSMVDVIVSCRCWIFLIFSAYTVFLMHPHRKNQVERDLGFEVAIDEEETFLQRLCFSDEATFYVNGCVNRHNFRIWGTQ